MAVFNSSVTTVTRHHLMSFSVTLIVPAPSCEPSLRYAIMWARKKEAKLNHYWWFFSITHWKPIAPGPLISWAMSWVLDLCAIGSSCHLCDLYSRWPVFNKYGPAFIVQLMQICSWLGKHSFPGFRLATFNLLTSWVHLTVPKVEMFFCVV